MTKPSYSHLNHKNAPKQYLRRNATMATYWKHTMRSLLAGFAVLVAVGSFAHAADLKLPFIPGQDQGIFLLISDLHFDPFASSDVVKRLNAASPSRWGAILDQSKKIAFSQYGNDANYPLMMSMIEAAKSLTVDYDFILFPGDYIAHHFDTRYQQVVGGSAAQYAVFVENAIRFINQSFGHAFPKIPFISALGNNDALCGDYRIAPNSPLLNRIRAPLELHSGAPGKFKNFAIGGFYAMPHPTVPDREIIVLNNILWSCKYEDKCNPNGGDPGSAQIAWLEWTLYRLQQKGKTATLVMHVPPGVNAYTTAQNAVPGHADCKENIQLFWADKYARQFQALVEKYPGILDHGFVGHTHMDDFRVVFGANQHPLLFTRISPAVSPIFDNNPAFTVVLYDRKTDKLLDYAVYALTNLTQAGISEPGRWALEYSFQAAYHLDGITPTTLAALSNAVGQDGDAMQKYVAYYAVGTSSGIDSHIKAYQCSQRYISVEEYADCYCGK